MTKKWTPGFLRCSSFSSTEDDEKEPSAILYKSDTDEEDSVSSSVKRKISFEVSSVNNEDKENYNNCEIQKSHDDTTDKPSMSKDGKEIENTNLEGETSGLLCTYKTPLAGIKKSIKSITKKTLSPDQVNLFLLKLFSLHL